MSVDEISGDRVAGSGHPAWAGPTNSPRSSTLGEVPESGTRRALILAAHGSGSTPFGAERLLTVALPAGPLTASEGGKK